MSHVAAPEAFVIDWGALNQARHADWHAYVRELLRIRRQEIVSRLPELAAQGGTYALLDDAALDLRWRCGDGCSIRAVANLGERELRIDPQVQGRILFCSPGFAAGRTMSSWSIVWFIEPS